MEAPYPQQPFRDFDARIRLWAERRHIDDALVGAHGRAIGERDKGPGLGPVKSFVLLVDYKNTFVEVKLGD